ncbi:hypothetical protein C0J52_12484 [Blattella germanica]|nr:hypothetical protein C0J52_12484 [Blattella germanica]
MELVSEVEKIVDKSEPITKDKNLIPKVTYRFHLSLVVTDYRERSFIKSWWSRHFNVVKCQTILEVSNTVQLAPQSPSMDSQNSWAYTSRHNYVQYEACRLP